jgi:hypothetical protein
MAGMGESRLSRAQDEINPLKDKGDNPVKAAAAATSKARSSKNVGDITGAANKTRMASLYSKSHGYPNLTKQLSKHKTMLIRYAAAVRKQKVAQSKAGRKARMQDLKAKLRSNARAKTRLKTRSK